MITNMRIYIHQAILTLPGALSGDEPAKNGPYQSPILSEFMPHMSYLHSIDSIGTTLPSSIFTRPPWDVVITIIKLII